MAADAQFMTGLRVEKDRAAQTQAITSRELVERVGFDQRLGAQLPLEASFRDEQGKTVKLGDFYGERPVILGLVYYRCPLLCTLIERATARGLKPLEFDGTGKCVFNPHGSGRIGHALWRPVQAGGSIGTTEI